MIIRNVFLNNLVEEESKIIEKKLGLRQNRLSRKQKDIYSVFLSLGKTIRERCKEGKELHWSSDIITWTKDELEYYISDLKYSAENKYCHTFEDLYLARTHQIPELEKELLKIDKLSDTVTLLEDITNFDDIENVKNIENMSDEELVDNFVKTIFLFLKVFSEKTLESLHLFYAMISFAQELSSNDDDEEPVDKLFDYLKFYYDYNFGRFD